MTYHQLQQEIVENKKLLTKAKFKSTILFFSIFTLSLLLCALNLCLVTLPAQWLLVIIILFLALYSTVLTSLTLSEKILKVVQKICYIWWLPIVLFIVENFILQYFNFI